MVKNTSKALRTLNCQVGMFRRMISWAPRKLLEVTSTRDSSFKLTRSQRSQLLKIRVGDWKSGLRFGMANSVLRISVWEKQNHRVEIRWTSKLIETENETDPILADENETDQSVASDEIRRPGDQNIECWKCWLQVIASICMFRCHKVRYHKVR